MPESLKVAYAYTDAHTKVCSRLDEIECNIDATVTSLKSADIRLQELLVDHEKRNSEAFLEIYSSIKTLSQISEQADMHLCQQLERNAEENKLKFKRIKYALIALGIANIISLAGNVIFYILNYYT